MGCVLCVVVVIGSVCGHLEVIRVNGVGLKVRCELMDGCTVGVFGCIVFGLCSPPHTVTYHHWFAEAFDLALFMPRSCVCVRVCVHVVNGLLFAVCMCARMYACGVCGGDLKV